MPITQGGNCTINIVNTINAKKFKARRPRLSSPPGAHKRPRSPGTPSGIACDSHRPNAFFPVVGSPPLLAHQVLGLTVDFGKVGG